jgi:hypothetical protein
MANKVQTERTKANKARRAETLRHRLAMAAERRLKPSNRKASRNPRAHEDRRREAARRVRAKQLVRQRRKGFRPARGIPSPSQAGERQFGPQAKGYHLHQKHNHLARALTPKEFQEWQESRSKKSQGQRRKELAPLESLEFMWSD